jgi:hypothetical protein
MAPHTVLRSDLVHVTRSTQARVPATASPQSALKGRPLADAVVSALHQALTPRPECWWG